MVKLFIVILAGHGYGASHLKCNCSSQSLPKALGEVVEGFN